MVDVLFRELKERLLLPGKPLFDRKLGEILGKIAVISDVNLTDVFLTVISAQMGKEIDNISSDKPKLVDKTRITRIYPKASFYTHFSYNYDPEPFWASGAQFVALN